MVGRGEAGSGREGLLRQQPQPVWLTHARPRLQETSGRRLVGNHHLCGDQVRNAQAGGPGGLGVRVTSASGAQDHAPLSVTGLRRGLRSVNEVMHAVLACAAAQVSCAQQLNRRSLTSRRRKTDAAN